MKLVKLSIFILLLFISLNSYSQDGIKESIFKINENLENDNSNKWIKLETFHFSYNNDTLYLNHLKEFKHGMIEKYFYSIPIVKIKSIEAQKSPMFKNNTLTIISKSNKIKFSQTYQGENEIQKSETTFIMAFSKKDIEEYKMIEEIISNHPLFSKE